MDDHPGGKKVIMAYAGRDASEEFNALHSASAAEDAKRGAATDTQLPPRADPNVLEKYLEKEKHKGPVVAARSKL